MPEPTLAALAEVQGVPLADLPDQPAVADLLNRALVHDGPAVAAFNSRI